MSQQLALLGGSKTVPNNPTDIFDWPIVGPEDEKAVLEVLHNGAMSGIDITKQFENEFARWQGLTYALGFNTGTASLHAAMFGCKVGVGDEIIAPSLTYWATALPAFSLGATILFADVETTSLCIDPADIERKISPHTKAIVVVHYLGHPADMSRIMDVADRHRIPVIEDVSHAHGGLYKGKRVGVFGKAAAMSLMSGKSLPVGEAGILATNDQELYERAMAFGHYGRYNAQIQTEDLKGYTGLPLGGYKYRMHQMNSALGRVQLANYDNRMHEIDRAMNYFWDQLDGVPGIQAHRTPPGTDSTMGGWYAARGKYVPEDLGGLSVTRFCEAVTAEGCVISPGANKPLHIHPLFTTCDVYGHGRPTRMAHAQRDIIAAQGSLPVTEQIGTRLYSIPWFKHFRPAEIDLYADAFKKVAEGFQELLPGDRGNNSSVGGWHFFKPDA